MQVCFELLYLFLLGSVHFQELLYLLGLVDCLSIGCDALKLRVKAIYRIINTISKQRHILILGWSFSALHYSSFEVHLQQHLHIYALQERSLFAEALYLLLVNVILALEVAVLISQRSCLLFQSIFIRDCFVELPFYFL